MNKLLLVVLISVLTACTNQEQEERIKQLEKALDQCQNGSEKILGKIQVAFDNENYQTIDSLFKILESKHPESPEFKKAKDISAKTDSILIKQKEEEKRLIEKQREDELASLKKLNKRLDDVSGITWYKQRYFTHFTNTYHTSIYMGEKDGEIWVNLFMSYAADDWIFFKRAFLSYDGNTQEILFDDYRDKETDNDSGGISEWITVRIDDQMLDFLEGLAKSPNAKMRFSGKYTKTRTLPSNERQGILDVVNGYKALEKQLSNN